MYMKKGFIWISTLSLVAALLSASFQNNPNRSSPKTRSLEASPFGGKEESLNYLNSYRNPNLKYDENGCVYSSKKLQRDCVYADNLAEDDGDDCYFTFEATYITSISTEVQTISMFDQVGNLIDKETLYGCMVPSKTLDYDIRFDIGGLTFLGSEVLDLGSVKKDVIPNSGISKRFMTLLNGDGSSGAIVSSLYITYAIVSLQDAKQGASGVYAPPEIGQGPIPYALYLIKCNYIESNYKNNIQQSQPELGKQINDQGDCKWKSWKFGMSTMYDAGCEIIALYNFLVTVGKNPYLPSLIALVQYSNADLFLGLWGSNPIPPELIRRAYEATKAFLIMISPVVTTAISVVAAAIVYMSIGAQNQFILQFIEPLIPGFILTTQAVLETALLTTIATVDLFAEYYLNSLRSITNILAIFGVSTKSSYSYQDYSSAIVPKTCFLFMSFWTESFPNNEIDYSQGMHTIFIIFSTSTSQYTAFNNYETNGWSYISSSSPSLNSFFGGSSKEKMFLTGFGVFK